MTKGYFNTVASLYFTRSLGIKQLTFQTSQLAACHYIQDLKNANVYRQKAKCSTDLSAHTPIAFRGGVLTLPHPYLTKRIPDLTSQIHRFMHWITYKAKQNVCFLEKNVSFRLLVIRHSLYETHEQES